MPHQACRGSGTYCRYCYKHRSSILCCQGPVQLLTQAYNYSAPLYNFFVLHISFQCLYERYTCRGSSLFYHRNEARYNYPSTPVHNSLCIYGSLSWPHNNLPNRVHTRILYNNQWRGQYNKLPCHNLVYAWSPQQAGKLVSLSNHPG